MEKLDCGVINGLMEVQSLSGRGRFSECETKAFHGLNSVLNLFFNTKQAVLCFVFFLAFKYLPGMKKETLS